MRHSFVAAAAILTTSHAASQNLIISLSMLDSDTWAVDAEWFGELPGNSTSIGAVWADTNVRITGDSAITITEFNDGYNSPIFGGPRITGNGSNEVLFAGVQPAPPLGTPDPSNPLRVMTFDYTGSLSGFSFELVGQNSALFLGDPANPFGTVLLYQDAAGNPGSLTYRVQLATWPTPGTAMTLGFAGLFASRRRR